MKLTIVIDKLSKCKIRPSHVNIDGHRNLKGYMLYILYSDFNRRWKALIIAVSGSSI